MTQPQVILTAHQPNYFPWLGLFHKIALANLYCVFDVAQYPRREYCNRNKIRTKDGDLWLTVPVESQKHFDKQIHQIRIVHDGWNRRHLRSIVLAYKHAPFLDLYLDEISQILRTEYEYLADLNCEILAFCLKALDLTLPIVKASDYSFTGYKSDLVLDMCCQLKATHYLFGKQGRTYADISAFNEAGIQVYFQDYRHPTYRQLHGDFKPYMSILDLLFNEGTNSKAVLLSNNACSLDEFNSGN
jgi:hypothetical protein